MATQLVEIDPWEVSITSLDPERIRLLESLMSLGNGHMGARGNFEEGYGGDSHLGTYVAGVWFPDRTRVGWWKNGYPEYFGKVINAVDIGALRIRANGEPVDLFSRPPREFRVTLDLRRGILVREFRCDVGGLALHIRFERIFSVVTPELQLQRVDVSVEGGRGEMEIDAVLDADVRNLDSNYAENFWEPAPRVTREPGMLAMITRPNPFGTPRFTVTAGMSARGEGVDSRGSWDRERETGQTFGATVQAGARLAVEKTVAVVTSRDLAIEDHTATVRVLLDAAQSRGHAVHRADQEAAWAERWAQSDVVISGDEPAQQGIRFTIFQLLSTFYGEDERLNIGPKGFTGEKYGGATYWDTEAFLLPMYMSIADADVSLSLLRYRHRQLPQARENARRIGMPGALYPMVTFDGIECHNEWEITFEEIHRNGAIAHAIRYYTEYTGDRTYLENEGIEVLVEIARFWAGRVHLASGTGRYMIHGVTGPNEYENNVNNNWYTNYLARWVLRYTGATCADLPQARLAALGVTGDELSRWDDIARRMYLPEDESRGIKVQHDTFLDKDLSPVSTLDPAHLPLNQNWSWDRILRSCYIKQADVLQGMYTFSEEFDVADIRRNFEFYEPLTVHESSLSPSIHAVLAASVGLDEKAMELYQRSARLDLDDYNNDTEDGLHITSMSGSWLALVQGFAGMRTAGGVLRFDPVCPARWSGFAFMIRYRERLLRIAVGPLETTYSLVDGEPLAVAIGSRRLELRTGEPMTVPNAR